MSVLVAAGARTPSKRGRHVGQPGQGRDRCALHRAGVARVAAAAEGWGGPRDAEVDVEDRHLYGGEVLVLAVVLSAVNPKKLALSLAKLVGNGFAGVGS